MIGVFDKLSVCWRDFGSNQSVTLKVGRTIRLLTTNETGCFFLSDAVRCIVRSAWNAFLLGTEIRSRMAKAKIKPSTIKIVGIGCWVIVNTVTSSVNKSKTIVRFCTIRKNRAATAIAVTKKTTMKIMDAIGLKARPREGMTGSSTSQIIGWFG